MAVHLYGDTGELTASDATVTITHPHEAPTVLPAPSTGTGRWWNIGTRNPSGDWTLTNQLSETPPGGGAG